MEQLIQRLELIQPAEILASEDFQAAVHRVFRAAQETPSEDKRRLLRNALLNGYVTAEAVSQRDEFLSVMARYQPEHVAVLQAMKSLMVGRTKMLEGARSSIHDQLEESLTFEAVSACLRELVDDGLISESTENRVEDVNVMRRYGPPQTRQVARVIAWHSTSEKGEAFIDFVADPFRGANEN